MKSLYEAIPLKAPPEAMRRTVPIAWLALWVTTGSYRFARTDHEGFSLRGFELPDNELAGGTKSDDSSRCQLSSLKSKKGETTHSLRNDMCLTGAERFLQNQRD